MYTRLCVYGIKYTTGGRKGQMVHKTVQCLHIWRALKAKRRKTTQTCFNAPMVYCHRGSVFRAKFALNRPAETSLCWLQYIGNDE